MFIAIIAAMPRLDTRQDAKSLQACREPDCSRLLLLAIPAGYTLVGPIICFSMVVSLYCDFTL